MVYIRPEGSPFENKDVFTELENSLLLLEHDGVCFPGDFNARTGIITDGYNNDLDMPYKVFDDAPSSDKIPSALPKRKSQDMATNNYAFRLLDFCKPVDVAIVNGRAGSDAITGKCTCKNVSVVDCALVSSDLFPLISDFAVLDFCELYSDVHCPIVLKLNLIEAQETELGRFESDDDDCLENADERNLQFITGKPVWCKTGEDEYIFVLDDAVINEINIVLDEELLSPEITSWKPNHIVLKINEVMKNRLSTGLFRECVCVREAGGVTAVLTVIRLLCRQDVSLMSCAGEGECVTVLTPFMSDLLPYILL